jgi:hypothetical protein
MSANATPSKVLAMSPAKSAEVTPAKNVLTPSKMNPYGDMYNSPTANHVVSECLCPTCQYYRAAMTFHHECQSPMVDQYQMYNGMMNASPQAVYANLGSPMMNPALLQMQMAQMQMNSPMMNMQPPMPPMSNASSPVLAGDRAAMDENVNPMSRSILSQFKMCQGTIAATACSPTGRSLLQSVIRMQHTDKIRMIFDEIMAAHETVLLDTHGCHVVRSLIEALDESQTTELIDCFDETLILNMSTLSQYTRRILQTLFERHPEANLDNIVEIISSNARYLAATQQGCISMMRVFEKCNGDHKNRLLANLLPMFTELACDPFGNYVVQCVLEHSPNAVAAQYVVDHFQGKFLRMACNKFASNVLERIIKDAPLSLRRLILDELVFNPAALSQLVHDGFGNFVVQVIIGSTTTPHEHKKIADRVKPVLANSPFGHKIENKLKAKRFNSNQQHRGNNASRTPLAALPVQVQA